MFFDQEEFHTLSEWGTMGVRRLAPASDVIVIVDVLSFSTCADIAAGSGGRMGASDPRSRT